LVVGFERHETERAVVFVEKGALFDRFGEIDAHIRRVEEFHTLHSGKKPRIFFFGDRTTYARRSRRRPGSSPFTTAISSFRLGPEGSVGWADFHGDLPEARIVPRPDLREAGILNAFRYPKWLLEGIAVYSAGQMGTSWYPTKDQVYGYIRNGDFMPPEFYGTGREEQVRIVARPRTPFIYSEFACIVDSW
jgi:hypothetical protein